jgi:hypothetical protein
LDSCTQKQEEYTCEPLGGSCKSICDSGEDVDDSKSCATGGDVCCFLSKKPSSGISVVWIIILIILIILVVLAIIFRHKLQIWWFRWRGKTKVSPVTRPGPPPLGRGFDFARFGSSPGTRPRTMPTLNRTPPATQASRVPGRRMSEKDKELEDTLKKLREMSK